MVITEETREKVVNLFRGIHSTKEDIKALNSSNNDIFKKIADDIGAKPKEVRKAYKQWAEKQEGDDSTDKAIEIIEYLKSF